MSMRPKGCNPIETLGIIWTKVFILLIYLGVIKLLSYYLKIKTDMGNIGRNIFETLFTSISLFYLINLDLIWGILENMLLNFPIVFVWKWSKTLSMFIEVLKNLIYPFEYQGLIIPFDPNPSQNLLMSKLPFIIGK